MIWRITWCRWNVRLELVAQDHVDMPFEDCCSRALGEAIADVVLRWNLAVALIALFVSLLAVVQVRSVETISNC